MQESSRRANKRRFSSTGFQALASSTDASLRIGDRTLPITYAGWGREIPGLDQLAVELPRSLAGAGRQLLLYRAAGKASNIVSVTFR